jgi:hypothetical protein
VWAPSSNQKDNPRFGSSNGIDMRKLVVGAF